MPDEGAGLGPFIYASEISDDFWPIHNVLRLFAGIPRIARLSPVAHCGALVMDSPIPCVLGLGDC